MTRSFHHFTCEGETLAGTLDGGEGNTGLLIVSGGNEVRSGAHSGMARLAQSLAKQGFPVFRYDRRGIGDGSGANGSFLSSAPDIAAATAYFRQICPNLKHLIAFGNCDAATALALFGPEAGIERYVLANPWVIEETANHDDASVAPPPSAIRARYWERLKNPRTIVDLFRGQINFKKFRKGFKQAAGKQSNSALAVQLGDALATIAHPCSILLARRDRTALAFQAAWNSNDYSATRSNSNIQIHELDSASHSFADAEAKIWLENQIVAVLEKA